MLDAKQVDIVVRELKREDARRKEWRRSSPSSGGQGNHHDPRSGGHLPPNERNEAFQIEGLLQDGAACVFEKLVGF